MVVFFVLILAKHVKTAFVNAERLQLVWVQMETSYWKAVIVTQQAMQAMVIVNVQWVNPFASRANPARMGNVVYINL